MKIFSLYGINKATERSYFYKQNKECDEEIPFTLNKHLTDDQSNIYHGVHVSDGDGTVPLLSLGFMSVKGWKSVLFFLYFFFFFFFILSFIFLKFVQIIKIILSIY